MKTVEQIKQRIADLKEYVEECESEIGVSKTDYQIQILRSQITGSIQQITALEWAIDEHKEWEDNLIK